jgi:hypothetical protein
MNQHHFSDNKEPLFIYIIKYLLFNSYLRMNAINMLIDQLDYLANSTLKCWF